MSSIKTFDIKEASVTQFPPPFRAAGNRTWGRISRNYQKQSNSEKSPLGIQFNNSILHLWYSAPLSLWFSECYYSEWKWMASTSAYARMQLPSIYHIWISAAARQNVIFNAILISTLKKLFVRQSGWRCSFPYARQIYSTPPDSIQATISLFCTTVQTPRCDGWGGCGWRDEKRQQRVFVKWLSGALGILAERDPLMGRQAGAVFGRPGDWWCTGLIQQTQILRSIMFSSQQLCWQNTRADSGAEMLRQNKPFESAAPMSFPLLGFVYVCISVFVCAYSLVSATRCVFKYKTIFQIDLLYIFVFKCWNIFVKFLRLYLQSTYTDDSECIFLYVMYVHLSECRSHTHTHAQKKKKLSA